MRKHRELSKFSIGVFSLFTNSRKCTQIEAVGEAHRSSLSKGTLPSRSQNRLAFGPCLKETICRQCLWPSAIGHTFGAKLNKIKN